MTEAYACGTLFHGVRQEEIVGAYEAGVEPANGYLTRLDEWLLLVDATATEMADWDRQIRMALALTVDGGTAISVFLVGKTWALALAHEGKAGPVAAFAPDEETALDDLPHRLLRFEHGLGELFPYLVDTETVDALFGVLLDGGISAEAVFTEILAMLEVPGDWLRWSWYETIPEQLFLDPDLAHRVTPLGEAKPLWEE
jgi:hypothetical protein